MAPRVFVITGPSGVGKGTLIRSLLDTDFYKLLMLQMIREFYPDQRVTFSVINRTRNVRLAEIIDEGELRAQLDHALGRCGVTGFILAIAQ